MSKGAEPQFGILTVREVKKRRASVLAIQDTTEVNYQSQADRKHNLGTVGNGTDIGLFLHPVLAVDADDGSCLGLVHAQIWRRKKAKAANYRALPIEKKESHRWLVGANAAKKLLSTTAAWVTIVADRESDIYEQWVRLPDPNTHLLSRACQDRVLADGGRLFATLDGWREVTRYEIDLPARLGKCPARDTGRALRPGRNLPTENLFGSRGSPQCAFDGHRRARSGCAAWRGTDPLAIAHDPQSQKCPQSASGDRLVFSALDHRTAVSNLEVPGARRRKQHAGERTRSGAIGHAGDRRGHQDHATGAGS